MEADHAPLISGKNVFQEGGRWREGSRVVSSLYRTGESETFPEGVSQNFRSLTRGTFPIWKSYLSTTRSGYIVGSIHGGYSMASVLM